jgi:hypothetical protein
MTRRRCTGQTKKGQPCKAAPLKDRDVCLAHADEELRLSAGFGGVQQGSGRPRVPRVTDVYADELHRRVGEHVEELIGRLVSIAMDAERTVVVGTGPNARTEIAPDQVLQLAALRELNDRILGRPRQSLEHSGPDGGPIHVQSPPDAQERARRALALLAQAGALEEPVTTNGHGNGNGSNGHH